MKAKIQTMIVIVLALAGLASSASAQYVGPGYGPPPAQTVGSGLQAGVTVSGTAETILFELDGDDAATQTFLSFTNVAVPAKQVTFKTRTDGTPEFEVSATDGTTAGIVTLSYGGFEIRTTGAVATDYNFHLADTFGTFLTFTNIGDSAKTITVAQDSSSPSLTTVVTNGTRTVTLLQNAFGFQQSISGFGLTGLLSVGSAQTGIEATSGSGSFSGSYYIYDTSARETIRTSSDGGGGFDSLRWSKKLLVDNTATFFLRAGIDDDSIAFVTVHYAATAETGTEQQVIGGTAYLTLTFDDGVRSCSAIIEDNEISTTTAGTITFTLTCDTSGGNFDLLATVDSSLDVAPRLVYEAVSKTNTINTSLVAF